MKTFCVVVLLVLCFAVGMAGQQVGSGARPAAVGAPARPAEAAGQGLEEERIAEGEPRTLALWEGKAPGAVGDLEVDRPTITRYAVWWTHEATAAVIVFPGGGYQHLAMNHEGRQIANWLNAAGITAFVVKYRLGPRYHHPVELEDAQRAIRMVRARAKEFRVLPDKIGVMGFSAGGHLASTTETHFDLGNAQAVDPIERVSSRPDFAVLAYPVISFTADYTHVGSRKNLLGENPPAEVLRELSGELNVTAQTPPTFLFSSSTDDDVPPQNSVAFYSALLKAGVPAELHIFERAPHGVGLDFGDLAVGEWSRLLLNWFRVRGVIARVGIEGGDRVRRLVISGEKDQEQDPPSQPEGGAPWPRLLRGRMGGAEKAAGLRGRRPALQVVGLRSFYEGGATRGCGEDRVTATPEIGWGYFWYWVGETCSSQFTALPSSFSWMAMWVMAVVGVAPCQCFSAGGIQTTSPGWTSSTGPPSRWTQPTPDAMISV